jgi:hypothetical protein
MVLFECAVQPVANTPQSLASAAPLGSGGFEMGKQYLPEDCAAARSTAKQSKASIAGSRGNLLVRPDHLNPVPSCSDGSNTVGRPARVGIGPDNRDRVTNPAAQS